MTEVMRQVRRLKRERERERESYFRIAKTHSALRRSDSELFALPYTLQALEFVGATMIFVLQILQSTGVAGRQKRE